MEPMGVTNATSVTIWTFEGAATRDEVEAEREALARRYAKSERYEPLHDLVIGGKAGWAYEHTDTYDGKLWARYVTAVVPWNARCSYALRYRTSGPALRPLEDMERVVASFEVGDVRRRQGWAFVASGLLVGALVAWRWSEHRRASRG